MLWLLIIVPVIVVYILTNLNYKTTTTIILLPILSIFGGLLSAVVNTPHLGMSTQHVVNYPVDNQLFLNRFLIHSIIVFFLVLVMYPLLKKRLKRKKEKYEIDLKSNHTFEDLFKQKDQSERDIQKEWIKKNFK